MNKQRRKKTKKYEFTGETCLCAGRKLRRIRLLRDILSADAGDLGGWIETENNLSHAGDCWVKGEAKVFDTAMVSDDAVVAGEAHVFECARVSGFSCVEAHAVVCDRAIVRDRAHVRGTACVCKDAVVEGIADVRDTAYVGDTACISGVARVGGEARIIDGTLTTMQQYVCVGPIGRCQTHLTLNFVSGTVAYPGADYPSLDEFITHELEGCPASPDVTRLKAVISFFKAMTKINAKKMYAPPVVTDGNGLCT